MGKELCLISPLSFSPNPLVCFPLSGFCHLFLSLLSFLSRPLHGGRTWWWNTRRPSYVSTQPTWTQLLRFSHLTAGTVFPCSSCWTTSWEQTVSEEPLCVYTHMIHLSHTDDRWIEACVRVRACEAGCCRPAISLMNCMFMPAGTLQSCPWSCKGNTSLMTM